MNGFGRIFRLQIFGESHGKGVGVLLDGCPAGVELSEADFVPEMKRRWPSVPGVTPRKEADEVKILAGHWRGRTTGAPLLLWIPNRDADSASYLRIEHTPRPGHADLAARIKYAGHNDPRGGGHFSGRLTAALVAAGVVAKKILEGVQISARVVSVGGTADWHDVVERCRQEGDSVGGVVECTATGIPAGLGEPFFDSCESLISHIVFSIGGVRGVEFGSGFRCAAMRGSECNDEILDAAGHTATNHAGGINGGITNGNPLVFRVAFKPPSSIRKPQRTVDLLTGKPTVIEVDGRHDSCIALRAPVVVEAACACVLADLLLLRRATNPAAFGR